MPGTLTRRQVSRCFAHGGYPPACLHLASWHTFQSSPNQPTGHSGSGLAASGKGAHAVLLGRGQGEWLWSGGVGQEENWLLVPAWARYPSGEPAGADHCLRNTGIIL